MAQAILAPSTHPTRIRPTGEPLPEPPPPAPDFPDLLKWQLRSGPIEPSWRLTIENARREIQAILEDGPSLKATAETCLHREYPLVCRYAFVETGLPEDRFPVSVP